MVKVVTQFQEIYIKVAPLILLLNELTNKNSITVAMQPWQRQKTFRNMFATQQNCIINDSSVTSY